MRWIEALNRFRAVVSGISFGDQAQFFRHELFVDSFPAIKLMEDIELSLRMKEIGRAHFHPPRRDRFQQKVATCRICSNSER